MADYESLKGIKSDGGAKSLFPKYVGRFGKHTRRVRGVAPRTLPRSKRAPSRRRRHFILCGNWQLSKGSALKVTAVKCFRKSSAELKAATSVLEAVRSVHAEVGASIFKQALE